MSDELTHCVYLEYFLCTIRVLIMVLRITRVTSSVLGFYYNVITLDILKHGILQRDTR